MQRFLMGLAVLGLVLAFDRPGRCAGQQVYTDRFNVNEEVDYTLEKVSRKGREVELSISAIFTKGARDREFLYFGVNMVDEDGNPHQARVKGGGNGPERVTLKLGVKTNLRIRFLLDPKIAKLQTLEVTMSAVERAAMKFENVDLTKGNAPGQKQPNAVALKSYTDRFNVNEEVVYTLDKVSRSGREVELSISATFTKGARDREFQYFGVNMVDVDGNPHQARVKGGGNGPERVTLKLGVKTNLKIRFSLDPMVAKLQTLEVTMALVERAAIKFTDLDLDEAAKGKVENEKGLSKAARLMIQLLKETGESVDNLEKQVNAKGAASAFPAIAQEFARRLTREPIANDEQSRIKLEAALAESPSSRELWHAELAKLELRPGKRDAMQAMIRALSHADSAAPGRYLGTNELALQQVIDDYAKAEVAGKLTDTQEVERIIVGKLVVESQLAAARKVAKQ